MPEQGLIDTKSLIHDQYNTHLINTYKNLLNKLYNENQMFSNSQQTSIKNSRKYGYINETNTSLDSLYTIMLIVYLLIACVLCVFIISLPISKVWIVLFFFGVLTFPYYIYYIELYIYLGFEYLYSIIMSIEYKP
jgi:hypothetical protein